MTLPGGYLRVFGVSVWLMRDGELTRLEMLWDLDQRSRFNRCEVRRCLSTAARPRPDRTARPAVARRRARMRRQRTTFGDLFDQSPHLACVVRLMGELAGQSYSV